MNRFNPLNSKISRRVFFSFLLMITLVISIMYISVRVNISHTVTRRLEGMHFGTEEHTENDTGMGGGGQGQSGQGYGRSVLSAEPGVLNEMVKATNETMFYATIAAVVFAGIAAVILSKQIVSPVRELTEASRKIADGDYSHRLPTSKKDPKTQDELTQLAESFNHMAAELEMTEERRQKLIGDVSHELRTPLTTIKGYMEALIDEKMPANQQTYQQIYQEADRLQRLTTDLQELSRVEAGAFELNIQPVRFKTLFDSMEFLLAKQFEDKGVVLDFSLQDPELSTRMDEQRISQVLINLVGNALQYTPEGGTVRLTAQKAGANIEVQVQDNGIGLTKQDLDLIFTRFYRADKSRSRASGGSGIGLTIAKHLVEAHGGTIQVSSEGKNKGSVFSFTLPLI